MNLILWWIQYYPLTALNSGQHCVPFCAFHSLTFLTIYWWGCGWGWQCSPCWHPMRRVHAGPVSQFSAGHSDTLLHRLSTKCLKDLWKSLTWVPYVARPGFQEKGLIQQITPTRWCGIFFIRSRDIKPPNGTVMLIWDDWYIFVDRSPAEIVSQDSVHSRGDPAWRISFSLFLNKEYNNHSYKLSYKWILLIALLLFCSLWCCFF